jgi:hypothetical protein
MSRVRERILRNAEELAAALRRQLDKARVDDDSLRVENLERAVREAEEDVARKRVVS